MRKIYNPSSKDIKDHNIDGMFYSFPSGRTVEIPEKDAKYLLRVYGFLIDWTDWDVEPDIKTDDCEVIERYKKEIKEKITQDFIKKGIPKKETSLQKVSRITKHPVISGIIVGVVMLIVGFVFGYLLRGLNP